eukprot:scaffold173430_cov19-Tisochrysis_lutea.AAC.2
MEGEKDMEGSDGSKESVLDLHTAETIYLCLLPGSEEEGKVCTAIPAWMLHSKQHMCELGSVLNFELVRCVREAHLRHRSAAQESRCKEGCRSCRTKRIVGPTILDKLTHMHKRTIHTQLREDVEQAAQGCIFTDSPADDTHQLASRLSPLYPDMRVRTALGG